MKNWVHVIRKKTPYRIENWICKASSLVSLLDMFFFQNWMGAIQVPFYSKKLAYQLHLYRIVCPGSVFYRINSKEDDIHMYNITTLLRRGGVPKLQATI